MPKKDRYSKEKNEKIVQATTGCRSLTDIFERLVLLYFARIILITQAACGTRFHKRYSYILCT